MPNSSKPRKAHTKKPGTPLSIRFTPEHERALQLVPHIELDNLRNARDAEHTFHNLALRVNFAKHMAFTHFTDVETDIAHKGVEALVAVKLRYERVGKYGASAQELQDIGEALNLADEIQKNSTRKEIRNSLMVVVAFGNKRDDG